MSPDLAPHHDASLEWWFAQGQFEGKALGRLQFMVSLFRHKSTAAIKQNDCDGYMLLVTTLDEKKKKHTAHSQVSAEFVAQFLREVPSELEGAGIDERLINAFTSEIARGGVPLPVLLADAHVISSEDQLDVEWGDLTVRQNGEEICISFAMPDNDAICRLELSPSASWLREDCDKCGVSDEQNLGANRFGAMAYESCPRLSLNGYVGDETISGEAWFDHQWGNFGWLKTIKDETEILGWNWFGINLDCGTDVIIMVRRNMHSGEILSHFAIVFAPETEPYVVDDVRLIEERRWVSLRSMVSYPVEWKIEIPSIYLDLMFVPLVDDQEVPVFGVINSIWEGVGVVDGTFCGLKVTGRARLELQGYGFILDFKSVQQLWIKRVDNTLRRFLPESLGDNELVKFVGQPRWSHDGVAQTEMLSKPIWDLLKRGGKHWRPIYGFLLLDVLGVDAEPFETLISVIPELVHNGSVIIDDIEDESQTRRGHQTVHLRYGLPTAINAGNMLYFLPLLSISKHPCLTAEQRDDIYRVIMEMFVQAHIGQAQDLYWSRPGQVRLSSFWQDENLGSKILPTPALWCVKPALILVRVGGLPFRLLMTSIISLPSRSGARFVERISQQVSPAM